MKRILKLILLTFISFTFYAGFKPTSVNAVITPDNNGNWYWGYESKLDEEYYSDLTGVTDKEEFIDTLALIISDAKRYSYGSDGTRVQLKYLDEDPNDTSKVICLYTGVSFSKSANGNTWNQEHTWAKSHGFPESTGKSWYAYSDLNHLRVTENSINSSRSNSDFFNVDNYTKKDSYGNYWTGSEFEPRDAVKGDVARIMMYMDIRYDGKSPNTNGVNLTLVNGSTAGTKEGKFGDLKTLLEWHIADPVDDYERRRNDRVYEVQGNRNPFIDHPEYANIIYGTNYDQDSDDKLTVSYVCDNEVEFDYVDTNSYVSGQLIQKPTINPVKEGFSFEGWYTESELIHKWDFSKNKITSNLNLYPKFTVISDPVILFQNIDLEAKLAVKAESSSNGSLETNRLTISNFNGGGDSVVSGKNNSVDLMNHSDYDGNLFTIIYNTNSSEYGYVGGSANHLRFYPNSSSNNGTSVVITAIDDSVKITNISIVASEYKNHSKEDMVCTVAGDQKSATVQNKSSSTKGHVKVTSIIIDYESSTSSYTVEGVKLAYRFMVEQGLYDLIKELDDNASFGIVVNNEKYELAFENNYITSKLNSIELDKNYEVCGYVLINGEYKFTESTIYSVSSMAEKYLDELSNDELITNNKGLLNYLKALEVEAE